MFHSSTSFFVNKLVLTKKNAVTFSAIAQMIKAMHCKSESIKMSFRCAWKALFFSLKKKNKYIFGNIFSFLIIICFIMYMNYDKQLGDM